MVEVTDTSMVPQNRPKTDPARNVSMIAPALARNVIQGVSAGSREAPSVTPATHWARVPTTISDSAVAVRNQIDRSAASSASPNQSAAMAQVPVITFPFASVSMHSMLTQRIRKGTQKKHVGGYHPLQRSDN